MRTYLRAFSFARSSCDCPARKAGRLHDLGHHHHHQEPHFYLQKPSWQTEEWVNQLRAKGTQHAHATHAIPLFRAHHTTPTRIKVLYYHSSLKWWTVHFDLPDIFFLARSSFDLPAMFSPAIHSYMFRRQIRINWFPKKVMIPEDPFEEGFEVTDGLANREVGGFIPLGFTGAALIFHPHPTVKKFIKKRKYITNEDRDNSHSIIYSPFTYWTLLFWAR